MNFLKKIALVLGLTGFLSLAAVMPAQAQVNIWNQEACQANPNANVCQSANADQNVNGIIRTITSTLLFLLGAVAVIMIIVSGFKYVASNGDQSKVASAKNTLMYSVIGLVVAVAAYAIVDFVLSRL